MKFLIVALPLFNKNMEVEAYRLNYRNGEKLFGLSQNYTSLDGIMNSPGLEIVNHLGVEPFTGGKPIFIEVSKYSLLMDLASSCKIPPDKIVWVVTNDVISDETYIERCVALKTAGFKFALESVPFAPKFQPFFKIADYVIIDSTNKERLEEMKFIRYSGLKTKFIIKNISSLATFEMLKNVSDSLFDGKFYTEPITKGNHTVSPLKINLLQLLKTIGKDDYELTEVSKNVQRDPALSISLLKLINSPALGITEKVTSIQNAVVLLGQREVSKWISVAASTLLSVDKPNEIARLALIRAKFCENLSATFHMNNDSEGLFLLGLFSLLDVILELPMREAVRQIAVSEDVMEALVFKDGKYSPVIELVRSYERGDWENVAYIMVHHNIQAEQVSLAFISALEWYTQVIVDII